MKKYLLEIRRTGHQIIIGYREGVLVYVEVKEGLNYDQVIWLHESLPHRKEDFKSFREFIESRGLRVSEILPDLSFKNFYDTYAYKKGKKSSVERIWNTLSETDKTKAIAHIKKYNFYLAQNPHIQKKYPQSYLNAQEWNN